MDQMLKNPDIMRQMMDRMMGDPKMIELMSHTCQNIPIR